MSKTSALEGHDEAQVDTDDSISLAPLVDTIRRYRRVIGIGLVASLAVVAIVALFLKLTLPSERFAAFSFRIEMDGAASGQYPNGAVFSPNDIIATPVLTQVFESNELSQYGTFAEFAVAFLIERWSFGRDVLSREYEAKLSDSRLSAVDRARLEAEFAVKLRALDVPEYRLSFRQSDAMKLPPNVISKVLEDTVATWARQADERKGALRYNLPVLSTTILEWDAIAREDYIIGIDILRGKVINALETIGKPDDLRSATGERRPGRSTLWTLPGANSIRSGPSKLTLAEVRALLENVLRFKIEPLLAFTEAARVSKQPELLGPYVDNQLLQMRLKHDEATRRVAAVEASMQQYALNKSSVTAGGSQNVPIPGVPRAQGGGETPAMIPQFTDSFLDRLVQMASRSDDVGYRQKLTDDLIRERFESAKLETETAYYQSLKLRLSGTRPAPANPGTAAVIEKRLKEAFDQVAVALDHEVALYDQISKNNLNPTTMLYSVTRPVAQQTIPPFTARDVGLWAVLVLVISFVLLLVGSFAHYYFWRSPGRNAAAAVSGK